MRRPDAAVARVPVRRRRLTCAGRSYVRPHAPTARILVGAGTPPANRSRSKPSRDSRVERGHDCPLSLGASPRKGHQLFTALSRFLRRSPTSREETGSVALEAGRAKPSVKSLSALALPPW